MKTEYEYLEFKQLPSEGKTEKWICLNKHHRNGIGMVQWYGPWRQYCFLCPGEIVFSAGCLEDISDFIKQLKEKRNNEPRR